MTKTNATYEWETLLSDIIYTGDETGPRGMLTKELVGNQTLIDMNEPIINSMARKVDYNFMFTEAWWILSGRNDVKSLERYAPSIGKFSDNGVTFAGAYGPRIVPQLRYVIKSLCKDQSTRQALMTIWTPNPEPSKDIPCTVSLQFLIRDSKLHCVATMRSSDAWIGYVYDIFVFTCISIYIAAEVKYYLDLLPLDLTLGNLQLTAGSQHLYEQNWDAAKKIFDDKDEYFLKYIPQERLLPIQAVAAGCFRGQNIIDILEEVKDRKYETE